MSNPSIQHPERQGRSFDPENYAGRLTALAVLLGLVGILWGSWWSAGLLLLAVGLLVTACYSRQQGFLVFGPLVKYDLIRLARRHRIALWRSLFALVMLAILCLLYASVLDYDYEKLFAAGTASIPIRVMANFANLFFGIFAGLMFFTVLFATPSIASVIAAEKEKKTLEFLLTTDLRNREIILGKVLSGLLNVLMYVLVGLPILALLPMFGGVDPQIVMATALGIVLTMAGVTGVAVISAVYAQNVKGAVAGTWRFVGLYAFLSWITWSLLIFPEVADFPSTATWQSPVTVDDLVRWFNAGNPISVIIMMGDELQSGVKFEDVLPGYLRGYAAFHLLVLGIFGAGGIAHLRATAAWQSGAPAGKKEVEVPPRKRPPVWDRPVLWKTLYCDANRPKTRMQWVMAGIFGVIALLPIVVLPILSWLDFLNVEAINRLARTVGAIVVLIGTLGTGAAMARSIGQERDKQTLEPLLQTTMEPREILWEKWLGSLLTMVPLVIWLIVNWIVLYAVGGLDWRGVILMSLVVPFYLLFTASLGAWCTVYLPTAEKALARYHWFIALIVLVIGGLAALYGTLEWEIVALGLLFGFLPPFTIGALTMLPGEFAQITADYDPWLMAGFLAAGLLFYGVMARQLWKRAARRFEQPPKADSKPA